MGGLLSNLITRRALKLLPDQAASQQGYLSRHTSVITEFDELLSAGARVLELLLGTESGCVREIITEELAKGLDAYWRISADDALDAARAGLVSALGVSSWFGTLPRH